MPEVAFVSYSNEDSRYDTFLENFIKDLRKELFPYGHPGVTREEETVFFDSSSIKSGDEWVERISESVSTCKVLVAFCSPRFRNSRFCGKEVNVFLRRLQDWQARNRGTSARPIICVLWFRNSVPTVLGRYQFMHDKLPKEYETEGLRTLCQLDEFKDQRTKVKIELAKSIDAALQLALPPLQNRIVHFDQIGSAFDPTPVGMRYGIAFVDLLRNDRHQAAASPGQFVDQFLLDRLMAEACGPAVAYRALEIDGNFADAVKNAKANGEAIVIVADFPTLNDPLNGDFVKVVDEAGGDNTGLVVASESQDVTNQQITLQGAFPKSYETFWEPPRFAAGEAELRQALSQVIAKLRIRLIGNDPAEKAQDGTIVQEAKSAGIQVERKPTLNGPGSSA